MKRLLVVFLVILMCLSGCSKANDKKTNETKQPEQKEKTSEFGADVVIIGAGGAGLSAAIEASDAGASVIILEKMPMIGGNTLRSEGGLNAAESKPQKDAGIKDSVEEMIKDTMKGGKEINNPELVKFFAENSNDAIDWLTKIGTDVSEVAQGAGATNPRMHRSKGGAKIGGVLIKSLEENIKKRNINVLLNTQATKLIVKDGKVVGVEAVQNGKTLSFKANAVVIATGGFGANESLFTQYRSDLAGFKTTNHKGATGDGIKMAQEVGAEVVDMKQIQTNPTVEVTSTTVISESVRGKGAILVNQEGKRFISEMQTRDVLSSAILKQKDKVAYLVFDEKVFSSMKGLQENYEKGIITKAATIDELAKSIQVDAKTLNQTISGWNKIVETKNDAEFERKTGLDNQMVTAPYYAIKVSPAVHYTMGGLKINVKAEVINKENKPIAGLFAAGEVTGGLHGANRLGGNAVADIVIFGRQSGQSAAAYAKQFDKLSVSVPQVEETKPSTPQVKGNFKDGTYTGSGQGNNSKIDVEVVVKDQSITSIKILKHSETENIFKSVETDLINKIIETQKIDVDSISGATNSSNGVKEAIKAALK